MPELLPLVFVKGFAGPINPAMARFLIARSGRELDPAQKRDGETDLQFLNRIDAVYADFKAQEAP